MRRSPRAASVPTRPPWRRPDPWHRSFLSHGSTRHLPPAAHRVGRCRDGCRRPVPAVPEGVQVLPPGRHRLAHRPVPGWRSAASRKSVAGPSDPVGVSRATRARVSSSASINEIAPPAACAAGLLVLRKLALLYSDPGAPPPSRFVPCPGSAFVIREARGSGQDDGYAAWQRFWLRVAVKLGNGDGSGKCRRGCTQQNSRSQDTHSR